MHISVLFQAIELKPPGGIHVLYKDRFVGNN